MKLCLVVLSEGTMKGKAIPINLSQFLIGRDKHCHLRPASPLVSNRHCALQIRDNHVFVRDFESTNGTYVNDKPIKGEIEIHDHDSLKIGPMTFSVRIEQVSALNPISSPANGKKTAEAVDDEAMAAMLLNMQEEGDSSLGIPGVDSEGVPTGSTVMDMPAPPLPEEGTGGEPGSAAKKPDPAKAPTGDTSAAANTLLQKYLRRGRK
jgi:pSer/pThr/pTyr-binding forkhead associated (FHA) protein